MFSSAGMLFQEESSVADFPDPKALINRGQNAKPMGLQDWIPLSRLDFAYLQLSRNNSLDDYMWLQHWVSESVAS